MKEFIYTLLSLLEYTVRALLLLKIFRTWLPFKQSFKRTGKYILCTQCVVTQYLLSETRLLKRVLYGEDMMVDRSIKSAVIVILCAAVTFVFSLWLFDGKLYCAVRAVPLCLVCFLHTGTASDVRHCQR